MKDETQLTVAEARLKAFSVIVAVTFTALLVRDFQRYLETSLFLATVFFFLTAATWFIVIVVWFTQE
jgi:hypothetical protein